MAITFSDKIESAHECSRTFPLGALPPHAISGDLRSISPEGEAFTAVGQYWDMETDFGKDWPTGPKPTNFASPKTSASTTQQQWD